MRTKLAIYGAGKRGRDLVDKIVNADCGFDILYIFDNMASNDLNEYLGIKIVKPEKKYLEHIDVIMVNERYKDEMIADLTTKGVSKDRIKHYSSSGISDLDLDLIKSTYVKANKFTDEIKEVIYYMKEHGVNVFNYPFVEKYNANDIATYFDSSAGLFYVFRNEKKMYFSRLFDTEEKVKKYYNSILIEQDEKSPHRYLLRQSEVPDNGVLLDGGVAEGFFTLDVIEKINHAFLVEVDENWVEALEYTFAPYQDKVTIIKKFLGDNDSESEITIESISKIKELDFIKLDIEGAETCVINAAKSYLKEKQHIKLRTCVYHRPDDEDTISEILNECDFNLTCTEGYMYYPYIEKNYKFVRGILKADK